MVTLTSAPTAAAVNVQVALVGFVNVPADGGLHAHW